MSLTRVACANILIDIIRHVWTEKNSVATVPTCAVPLWPAYGLSCIMRIRRCFRNYHIIFASLICCKRGSSSSSSASCEGGSTSASCEGGPSSASGSCSDSELLCLNCSCSTTTTGAFSSFEAATAFGAVHHSEMADPFGAADHSGAADPAAGHP